MSNRPELASPVVRPVALLPGRQALFPDTGDVPLRPLSSYRQLFWRRRWTIFLIAFAVFLVFLYVLLRQQPMFHAKGTLEIEMPKSSVASLGELFQDQTVPESYLQTQVAILMSPRFASRVIGQLGLTSPLASREAAPAAMEPSDFQRRLAVNVMKGTQLIEVGFDSESPDQAAEVANQLMAFYIDQVRERRSATAQSASAWLLDQLNQTKTKLEQATGALQRYEEEHRILFVTSLDGAEHSVDSERLQQLQAELTRVQTLRIEKESLYRQIKSGDLSVLRSPVLEELLQKEDDLAVQLAQLSAEFGPKFPHVLQLQEELKQARAAQEAERERLSQKTASDYQTSIRQEALIQATFQKQQELVGNSSQEMLQDMILKREVDLQKRLYEGLLQQINEAGVSARFNAPNARIFEPAEASAVASRPRLAFNLILGALTGLIVGMGLVSLQENLRDTFQSQEDVETSLNVPLLGVIPAIPRHHLAPPRERHLFPRVIIRLGSNGNGAAAPQVSKDWFRLDSAGPDNFELSESIRNLRTSFLYALDGAPPRSVLISSAVPSEGKTTIAANLCIALAQLGKRVLLVDADLRRPSVHKIFFADEKPGLVSYLLGNGNWRDFVHATGVSGLDIIAGAERPLHPAELLSSPRLDEFIRQAALEYDVVMLDSPILLNMADSRVLASLVESVVLVIHGGQTPRKLVKQACANLRNVPCRLIGIVLNQMDISGEDYAYGYSHGSEETEGESRKDEVGTKAQD